MIGITNAGGSGGSGMLDKLDEISSKIDAIGGEPVNNFAVRGVRSSTGGNNTSTQVFTSILSNVGKGKRVAVWASWRGNNNNSVKVLVNGSQVNGNGSMINSDYVNYLTNPSAPSRDEPFVFIMPNMGNVDVQIVFGTQSPNGYETAISVVAAIIG